MFNTQIQKEITFNKQVLYKLIDNKYNHDELIITFSETDNYNNYNNYNIYNNYKYEILVNNALKYNYKKYNNIITKLTIYGNNHYLYNFNYKLQNNSFNYFSLNNNLINIHINFQLIDDNNLKILCTSLKNNTNLKILDLSHNKITYITPLKDVLKNNTNLKRLDLSENYITDLSPLKNNTNLKILDLSHNKITNITPLKNNINLKTLDLSYNEITDITPLCYILNNNTIKQINISNNKINNIDKLSEYLKNNNSLQELYIDAPYIEMNIKKYYIKFNQPSDGELFSIKQQDNNENNLNDNYCDLSNIFKALEYNNSLKLLNTGYNILNNTEYYNLCNMLKVNTSINSLYINNTFNEIKEFNHDYSELFNILKFNNSIQELSIISNEMNKKEIKNLSEMLKYNISLKKLMIDAYCIPYNDWFLIYKSLEFNNNLEKLHLYNNKLSINDADKRYNLYLLCKSLYFNKSIKYLYISNINPKDIDLIANLLKYNHHIKDIFLTECLSKGINYDINIVNDLKNKIKELTNFNKTLYNDY